MAKVSFGRLTAAQLTTKVGASQIVVDRIYFVTNGSLITICRGTAVNAYEILYQDAVATQPVLDSTGQKLSYTNASGVAKTIDLSGMTLGNAGSNIMIASGGAITGAGVETYYLGKVGANYPRTAIPTVITSPSVGVELAANATCVGGIIEMTEPGTIVGGPDNGVSYVAGDFLVCTSADPFYHRKVAAGEVSLIYFGDAWKTDTTSKGLARIQNTLRRVRDDIYAHYQKKGDNITMGAGKSLILDHDPTLPMEAVTKQFAEALVGSFMQLKQAGGVMISYMNDTNVNGLKVGDAYVAGEPGIYTNVGGGVKCEIGDIMVVIGVSNGTTCTLADWTVLQNNLDVTILVTEAGNGLVLGNATVGKKLSLASITQSNTASNASPGFGGTFTAIDNVITDAYGRVTGFNLKTITNPTETAVSVAVNASTSYKVLVNMTASGHGLTPTYADVMSLLLTGWATTADTGSILVTDSIKIALNRLQNRITSLETRVTTVEGLQDWIIG